jgi:hypothetical protein
MKRRPSRLSQHQKIHRKEKRRPLSLQQRNEIPSEAVFWSPSTIREARVRNEVQQREVEEEKFKRNPPERAESGA